ncbi:MAG: type III-A CRISPR-associated RAMP protein Csm5, partial [Chloroflexi bacterium]|nr:type III-A CRISPR-associated RAMP protein Csm5 [Chloroflexota bacterium]
MADYALYDVTVETLSPLHIGSGETLLKEYDYAVHGGRTWRLNLDVLFEERGTDPQTIARLSQVPPAQLLRPQDYVEG